MLTHELDNFRHMQEIYALKRGRTNRQFLEPCLFLKLPPCYVIRLHTCDGKTPKWRICDTNVGLLKLFLVETTFNPQLRGNNWYLRSNRQRRDIVIMYVVRNEMIELVRRCSRMQWRQLSDVCNDVGSMRM